MEIIFPWITVAILGLIHVTKIVLYFLYYWHLFFKTIFLHYGWFIVIFLERDLQRDNSFKFLTYQLDSSVLDYWGVDG